ncbi:MAG: isochorismatase family protein, partial [Lachnospiraceae bacterium]|nr:isochorismatase family protein [Lachnospiraceae bacterium]
MDMQKKYMHLYDRGLVERVNAQIRGAKSAGAVVVYMRNKGTEQEAEAYGFAEGLDVISDHIFTKVKQSAFSCPEFVMFLDECHQTGGNGAHAQTAGSGETQVREAEEIRIVGADGRVCVPETALDAVKHGYPVTVDLDAVGAVADPYLEEAIRKMWEAGVKITGDRGDR